MADLTLLTVEFEELKSLRWLTSFVLSGCTIDIVTEFSELTSTVTSLNGPSSRASWSKASIVAWLLHIWSSSLGWKFTHKKVYKIPETSQIMKIVSVNAKLNCKTMLIEFRMEWELTILFLVNVITSVCLISHRDAYMAALCSKNVSIISSELFHLVATSVFNFLSTSWSWLCFSYNGQSVSRMLISAFNQLDNY